MERTLQQTQAASGAAFSVFALAHIFNQMLAAAGPATYDGAQETLRAVYQWAPVELVLVFTPLVVHVACGVARIVRRRRAGERPSPALRHKLHRWSGWFLLTVVFGHAAATRGASLFFSVFPRFEGVAFTLRWIPAIFWPYYTLLGLTALYHSVHGLGLALPMFGVKWGHGLRRPALLTGFMVVAGAALVAGVLGFGGVLADVGAPDQGPYAQLLRKLGLVR